MSLEPIGVRGFLKQHKLFTHKYRNSVSKTHCHLFRYFTFSIGIHRPKTISITSLPMAVNRLFPSTASPPAIIKNTFNPKIPSVFHP